MSSALIEGDLHLAERIRIAERELNSAVQKARSAGLRVDVKLLDITTVGDRWPALWLQVRLFRPVPTSLAEKDAPGS